MSQSTAATATTATTAVGTTNHSSAALHTTTSESKEIHPTTTGTAGSNSDAASSTAPSSTPSLPSFIALHPPPPSEHQPPPTSKLQRMQLNAQQERSPSENRLIDFKLRLLGGVFAGLVLILPFVAYALQPKPHSSVASNSAASSALPSKRS